MLSKSGTWCLHIYTIKTFVFHPCLNKLKIFKCVSVFSYSRHKLHSHSSTSFSDINQIEEFTFFKYWELLLYAILKIPFVGFTSTCTNHLFQINHKQEKKTFIWQLLLLLKCLLMWNILTWKKYQHSRNISFCYI